MSAEHPTVKLQMEFSEDVLLTEYPYDAKIRFVETAISYDGEVFSVNSLNGLAQDENSFLTDEVYEEITTFGWRHANLIVCGFLALLEAYGQSHLLNDPDIQEDFAQMVQAAKDTYAEKAFEQIRNGLQDK